MNLIRKECPKCNQLTLLVATDTERVVIQCGNRNCEGMTYEQTIGNIQYVESERPHT